MNAEWDEIRGRVLRRDGYKCVQCGNDLRGDGAHVHHVLPRAAGGPDEPANLISLCQMCHAAVHPHLGVRLARRLLQKAAVRLATWFDREGRLARQTRHLGPALKLFGLEAFRPAQIDVVEAALLGRSLLLVSPTGSGKSLTFQVPAVLTPGLCLVISPLKALMSDQVSGLLRHRLPATFMNSDLSSEEKQLRLELLERGCFKFLYLAPERFFGANERELARLRALRPAYLVVDEAHCIDRWGRDFRPEYGRLGEVRERLGNPPVLAFTATAGRETQARILTSLGAPEAEVFVHGANRPNISFLRRRVALQARPSFVAELLRLAEAVGVKAMVFVPTRKVGEALATALEAQGSTTSFYHGQLPAREKQDLLQRFGGHLEPKLSRIICTNAFGMGVDIPDVRLVIHWQHPASPEDYLQEFGRAGRDGRRSVAVLLTDEKPEGPAVRLLDFMAGLTVKQANVCADEGRQLLAQKRRLSRQMQEFAFGRACFRDALLGYFGEARAAPRRPLALRIVDWVFARRQARVEAGVCCDACHARGCSPADHSQFVCEALGVPPPPRSQNSHGARRPAQWRLR
ncbi:RecQ family ATP-dependent DNA helicase [Roseomonas sp. E05]|uniref:RecQ family ATP-dependent DNA helicase n=1 Tax=Roseomonas sp. E05 TaxID=3046310 RepID=UPI0024B9366D|nr:RecQ family ATP-dependent DNA helicase [Roseomonas sp. E05]MDJ0391636.1 RecQ family ATP-dependent DNA helicase [Roseomonas sp. E05]